MSDRESHDARAMIEPPKNRWANQLGLIATFLAAAVAAVGLFGTVAGAGIAWAGIQGGMAGMEQRLHNVERKVASAEVAKLQAEVADLRRRLDADMMTLEAFGRYLIFARQRTGFSELPTLEETRWLPFLRPNSPQAVGD